MSLGEIISDAVKYPFSDITKFIIVGILVLLAAIPNVVYPTPEGRGLIYLLLALIGFIFSIVLSGYSMTVIKNGIEHSSEIPGIDPVANFIDGIKVIIIGIVYFIIPIIIASLFGGLTSIVGAGLNHAGAGLGIGAIVSLIVFVIFSIFEIVALSRFADTDEMSAAFNFGAVIEDAKRIGFLNIILFTIVALILVFVVSFIVGILAIIPFIGPIVAVILLGGFFILFYYRGIGLLYASA